MTRFIQQVDIPQAYRYLAVNHNEKQMHDRLQESQRQYEQLINTIDSIVWEADAQTFEFSFVSKQAERLLGYPAERWITEPTFWQDHIHPDDRDWAINFCVVATAEQRAHEFEYRMVAADGRTVWLRDIVTVVVEEGRPLRLRGVMIDITRRKEAERAVAERTRLLEMGNKVGIALSSSATLKSMLQRCVDTVADHMSASLVCIWTLSDGQDTLTLQGCTEHKAGEIHSLIPIDPAVAESAESLFKLTLNSDLLESTEGAVTVYSPLVAERQPVGILALKVDQELSTLQHEALASICGGIANAIKRVRTEQILVEREELYRNVFESVSDGLLIFDIQTGELTDFNAAASTMHGYSRDEFQSVQPQDFIHPESHHLFEKHLDDNREGSLFSCEVLHLRKDGSVFPVEVFASALEIRGRLQSLSVVRDITERVQAIDLLEERVKERTQELQALLEISRLFASTLEIKPLLDLILDQLHALADYQDVSLLSLTGTELTLLGYRGPIRKDQIHIIIEWWQSHFKTVQQGGFIHISDTWNDPQRIRDLRQRARIEEIDSVRSLLGIPLVVKDSVIGLMTLSHGTPGFFNDQQIQLMTAVAGQIAIAIENARLYEQTGKLAALEERQKLARELHDSVSQALYGISLGARTARTLVDDLVSGEVLADKLIPSLDYVLSLADAGLTEMRALIFELRPESLATDGLVAMLARQAAAIEARHRIPVLTNLCPEPESSLAAKEALYRIAQEALNNTVKHAGAEHIELHLVCDGQSLCLEIKDDGCGFDTQATFPGHLGLKSMQERIEAVHGTLTISSHPEQGTTIIARTRSGT